MRRRDLSDDELSRVIKLKQAGASWLKIQDKTRVPRRSAKRAYEDWQRNQSMEELKVARMNVAAEAFREHVNSLSKLAKSLVDHLDVPESPDVTMNAEQFLHILWETNILGELEDYRLSQTGGERERQRITRQYQRLFQSLQDHTREKVRWDLLNEWKHSWDNCIKLLGELGKEAHQVIDNILNQEVGLLNKIKEESGKEDAVKRMAEAVVNMMWQRIVDDKLDSECPVVKSRSYRDGTTHVTSYEFPDKVVLEFINTNLSEKVAGVCNWAANNLSKGDKSYMVDSLRNAVRTMRKAIEALAEILNPLTLRPMILRTRCDLCPA